MLALLPGRETSVEALRERPSLWERTHARMTPGATTMARSPTPAAFPHQGCNSAAGLFVTIKNSPCSDFAACLVITTETIARTRSPANSPEDEEHNFHGQPWR